MDRRSTLAVVLSGLALLFSLSGVAGAGGDLFSDIGSHAFRVEINRIGRAGCAAGFDDGTFQPRENVTRGQFAFWTNNCGGRAGFEDGSLTMTAPGDAQLLTLTMTADGADTPFAQGGFVVLSGGVTARVISPDAALCPCGVDAFVHDTLNNDNSGIRVGTLGSAVTVGGTPASNVSLPINAVFPLDAGQSSTYELNVSYGDDQSPDVSWAGDLTAVWVPFGADGDRSLNGVP
jgi:hypothetical protein